jgi:hypothetical protein
MPPAGFEPATPAGDRLQTQALDNSLVNTNKSYIFRTVSNNLSSNLLPLVNHAKQHRDNVIFMRPVTTHNAADH